MLDIHIHILPGVDDGAQDYDDAIGMAELALQSGVTTIVATPHANQMGRFENFYTAELSRRFERLEDMLHSSRRGLRPGHRAGYAPAYVHDCLRHCQ